MSAFTCRPVPYRVSPIEEQETGIAISMCDLSMPITHEALHVIIRNMYKTHEKCTMHK